MRKIYRKPEIKTFGSALTESVLEHSSPWADSNDSTFDTEEDETMKPQKGNIWE